MLHLEPAQRVTAREALNHFTRRLEIDLVGKLSQIPYYQPTEEISSLYRDLTELQGELATQPADGPLELSDRVLPMLKRVVMEYRRSQADEVERLKERTTHPELHAQFEGLLRPIDDLISQAWFEQTEARSKPGLANYFAISQLDLDSGNLPARRYDEKFHILQAPDLFLSDLNYHRARCEMRGVSLVVAFMDIDDFKEKFNTPYGEVNIDRNVLPPFMRCIESHLYQRGFGYRFGGDEYVLLCPNMSSPYSIQFLRDLSEALAGISYREVAASATVSIGFCEIEPDSFLTNKEILEFANRAKKFAKDQGKNCIATYRKSRFFENQLRVAEL